MPTLPDMSGRILFINPNSSTACGAGIAAALAPFRAPGLPTLEVVSLPEGPPAIYTWADWFSAAGPILACIGREQERTDAFVIACASDPALPAAREATRRPVFGMFSSAVLQALGLAERFGVIAIVSASVARHALALRQLGVEARLAAEVPLDVTMDTLLDPVAVRARMIAAGTELVARGAGAVVLGCAGMAHHRAAIEQAIGVPVVEPAQAAAALALSRVLALGAATLDRAAE
ncbi:aspartate/glutamate racemase family protein [Elioraea rosea]|uniref:aspartate/glutamate racemase family protein n=1 Tax=Elioraea rosea TaxID=2492390 RepID=UPI001EF4F8C1|nr:aspartate/glutamate racemase family protein [Elioraea rosea]